MTPFGTLSLGELLQELKSFRSNNTLPKKVILHAPFANANISINRQNDIALHSYRGYYNHLAIDFDHELNSDTNESNVTLENLISALEKANGCILVIKAEINEMDLETPIWVSHYGDTGYKILGVDEFHGNIFVKCGLNYD